MRGFGRSSIRGIGAVVWLAASMAVEGEEEQGDGRKFRDPLDGCFDLSAFIDDPLGFVPLIVPITEPAVGGGAAVLPIFIDKPEGAVRPNIGTVGAMRTSNGSEALLAAYSGYFLEERQLHLVAGVTTAEINLDFYGNPLGVFPNGIPFGYQLDVTGGLVGAEWNFADSPWHAGLRYAYADVGATLQSAWPGAGLLPPGFPGLGALGFDYRVSRLEMSVLHDTRDNVFTPTTGLVSELALGANLEALGGSSNFQYLRWTNLWYRPLVEEHLFLGVKGQIEQSFGDMPFYLRPGVQLRGAPAARYQGDGAASLETELRWQVTPRWSLVGFGGAGFTWSDRFFDRRTEATFTGGAGFRYLIARRYGLHMGMDVAYGEEGPALYVQFGSAWSRF